MTVSRTLAGGKNVRPEVQERVLEAVHDTRLPPQRERAQHPSRAGERPHRRRDHQPRQPVLRQLRARRRGGRRRSTAGASCSATPGEDLGPRTPADRRLHRPPGRGARSSCRRADDSAHLQPGALARHPARARLPHACTGSTADAVVLDDVGGAYRGTQDPARRRSHADRLPRQRDERLHRAAAIRGLRARARGARYRGRPRAGPSRAAGCRDGQRSRCAQLLDLAEPPTAVFSANNRNTIGALKEIGARLRRRRAARRRCRRSSASTTSSWPR